MALTQSKADIGSGPATIIPATKFSDDTLHRIDYAIAAVDQVTVKGLEESVEVIAVLTHELEAAVGRQFKAGTDKDGDSHDKTGHTLSTLRSDAFGLTGVVEMDGGATFVEFGTPEHEITVRDGGLLHWQDKGGADRYAHYVKHPGYKGDDFVGRAIDEIDLAAAVTPHFATTFLSIFVKDEVPGELLHRVPTYKAPSRYAGIKSIKVRKGARS